jgi:type III secretion system YscD/HrpQ family protein
MGTRGTVVIGYLICEDGPQIGLVIPLHNGSEWVIGRDPNSSAILLEDPMVSRKHGIIRLSESLFVLENLSEVNPIKINGEPVSTSELQENDTLQIGNNYFRFTLLNPDKGETETQTQTEAPSSLPFTIGSPSRFFIKVLSGPNQGAEFGMNSDSSYVLGKDASADIVFQDLSVSHRHAKLTINEDGSATIEDLNSRNGIIINGLKIEGTSSLQTGGVVSVGTTVFLFVDKEASEQTIYSPSPRFYEEPASQVSEVSFSKGELTEKNWKETRIPTKHLVLASSLSVFFVVGLIGLISLFHSQEILPQNFDPSEQIHEKIAHFSNVQYSFTEATGKLFLIGHVLTDVEYAELSYLLNSLPFITQIEDSVVIDEGVWQEMNALISKNPNWRGITMSATAPGKFVLRGYLPTEADNIPLQDYINLNFPYLNLLDNQVIIENTLQTQVETLLLEHGFTNTDLQMGNGEVLIAGKVSLKRKPEFMELIGEIQKIPGVRQLKNFVVYVSESSSLIDLTAQYKVMGSSKLGNISQYVLIGGKILAIGDTLDGMMITNISGAEVLLDKDGIKYKIDYNQQ